MIYESHTLHYFLVILVKQRIPGRSKLALDIQVITYSSVLTEKMWGKTFTNRLI